MNRFFGAALAVMAMGASPVHTTHAQSFPVKPVRVIVPYPPGGGTDTAARGLTQYLSRVWNQPVIIENRPGGGTVIGAEVVAKAPPDGYSLLFSDTATFVISPHLYAKMPYDPAKAFAPITNVCTLAPVFAVANNIPANTLQEFVAHAKANPGKLSYGSFGNGSYGHVATSNFARIAGVDMVHVPYKGGAPAVTDLVGGQIALMLGTIGIFDAQAKAGKLHILASATERRLDNRPSLPTVAEAGWPGYVVNVFFAMAAPAGTPTSILDRIQGDIVRALGDPEFRERHLAPQSLEPGGMSRADFTALLASEMRHWENLVKASGAKVE